MTQRSTNQCAICCHFWHSGTEVMAVLASVMCEPGCQNFLQRGKSARGDHFRSQRIGLELLQIGLTTTISMMSHALRNDWSACRQIARLSLSTGDCFAYLVQCILLSSSRPWNGGRPDGLLFKFDGHVLRNLVSSAREIRGSRSKPRYGSKLETIAATRRLPVLNCTAQP